MKNMDITKEESLHTKLVKAAYRWVLGKSCGVAFKEFYSFACNGEYPDVIGFGSGGHSVLVECKASRGDFFSDRKKSFRCNPDLGMGKYRFYCCPTGLIKIDELPPKWGLVYVTYTNGKGKAIMVHNPFGKGSQLRENGWAQNMRAEHGVMYSGLRRLHLRGLIDEIYTQKIKTPPLPSMFTNDENDTPW